MKGLLQRGSLALLAAVVALSAWVGVSEQGNTALRTALFVPEIVSRIPVKLQPFLAKEPLYKPGVFQAEDGRQIEMDLYIPDDDGMHPAVVLFFGVIPAGRDDPRIVGLANGLARSGIVVLIPWSEVMLTSRRMEPEAVEIVVSAYLFLEDMEGVDKEQIGLAGFCVGASFAALAAQDERISDRVAYANLFGAYYDARDLMVSVASQSREYNGSIQPWQPRDDTQEVFTRHLIEALPNAEEQEVLRRVFLEGETAPADLPDSLSEYGQAAYRLLSGVDRNEAEELLRQLPVSFLEELESISPSTRIDRLKAPVLLMHDREDTAIPAVESKRMAESLAEGRVYYTEFSIFQHVDPTRQVPFPELIREMWKLYLHMYNVMRVAA